MNFYAFLVGKERICQVTPVAIQNNRIFTQMIFTKNGAEQVIVIHNKETDMIFARKGMALSSIKFFM